MRASAHVSKQQASNPAISASEVNLTWADNSSGSLQEANFEVQRAVNVVTSTANATGTGVGGLTNNTTYYFRVRAANAIGTSAWSNTASATTKRR